MIFLNLDSSIRWLFLADAIAGALALSVLVIPLASKKGGSLHVKTGWVQNDRFAKFFSPSFLDYLQARRFYGSRRVLSWVVCKAAGSRPIVKILK
ncbi:MAG: hypothetical protein B7Y39_07605 [Bdellovibrio sp. 28-41-41]|nr:MAG: hypothetical protein B7Y39_07605 [Bdellovibrio sp. 28-41-41]